MNDTSCALSLERVTSSTTNLLRYGRRGLPRIHFSSWMNKRVSRSLRMTLHDIKEKVLRWSSTIKWLVTAGILVQRLWRDPMMNMGVGTPGGDQLATNGPDSWRILSAHHNKTLLRSYPDLPVNKLLKWLQGKSLIRLEFSGRRNNVKGHGGKNHST